MGFAKTILLLKLPKRVDALAMRLTDEKVRYKTKKKKSPIEKWTRCGLGSLDCCRINGSSAGFDWNLVFRCFQEVKEKSWEEAMKELEEKIGFEEAQERRNGSAHREGV